MPKSIELIYKNNSKKLLDEMRDGYTQKIESVIKEMKYVPGESSFEVTESDIVEASRKMERALQVGLTLLDPADRDSRSIFISYLIDKMYLFVGGALLLYGALRPQLIEMDRLRLLMVMTGLLMITISYMLKKYTEIKRKQQIRIYMHRCEEDGASINKYISDCDYIWDYNRMFRRKF